MNSKFTSPATGLEFEIIDDDNTSYILHAITGDRIPLLFDVESNMLLIPAWALKHFELITTDEAASITGLSRQRVCELARTGKIDSIKVGNRLTLISRESAVNYAKGN